MPSFEFDPSTVEPSQSFDILPPGKYTAEIAATEIKEAKSGNGSYLKLEYTILDGAHANRKVWSQHNIIHSSPKAETVGRQQLSSICHAAGVTGKLTDTDQLVGKPMQIDVGVEAGNGTYGDKNIVKGWGAIQAPLAPVASKLVSAPAATAKRAPWQKTA